MKTRRNRSARISLRVRRERSNVRILGFLIATGGLVVFSLGAYCALGYDSANVTADPADYARVVMCVLGLGLTFVAAGVVTFVASWSLR